MTAPPHGVLVVDKPPGRTSHDVVAEARRRYGTRAVGHAGTLDPMATGVLVLLFGEACKLSPYLTAEAKAYFATVRFGASTDSGDADGAVVETVELEDGWLDPAALSRALAAEAARTEQIPPSVSAIQQDGERAYVRARRGEALALPPRAVEVFALSELERGARQVAVDLRVSKGYYVRAFARDLGAELGVPAHLAALRRHASGNFQLDEAVPWPPEGLPPLLGLADAARRALPVTTLSTEAVQRARHGKRLGPEEATASSTGVPSAWLTPEGELVAVGESDSAGHRVIRGFAPASG